MKDLLMKIPRYLALFFVSAYVMGLALFLVRFFSLTAWGEYGVGIVTVALTGVALSGASQFLFYEFFQRNRSAILFWLPFVLLFVSALAFQLIAANRFNPYLMQQGGLWPGQALNLFYCYLALMPVFFLAGLFLGLSFLDLAGDIPQAAVFHLLGSAAGLLLIFVCQSFIHPFHLLAVLLPVLALAPLGRLFILRYALFLTGLILLLFITGLGMWRVLDGKPARIPNYKALASAMKVEGNRVVAEIPAPGGYYRLLDNFTERRNIDLSSQYGFPRIAGKPPALGLYRDGDRILGLYREGTMDRSYFAAALESFPYLLKPTGNYLLIGTEGGFKIQELWGEKRTIHAVEPDRTIHDLIRKSITGMAGISLVSNSPLAALEPQRFEVIDMGATFLGEGEANRYALTIEAVSRYLVALKDDGILSLPVATAGFPAYAVKLLNTVTQSLRRSGVDDAGRHILVYRSALGARILVSRKGFTDDAVAALQTFCRERAFDVSWHPGIDAKKSRVWHALPAWSSPSLSNAGVPADMLQDAALKMFRPPGAVPADAVFNVEPATLDRPFFFGIVPLKRVWSLLPQWSFLPRAEIGQVIRPAVLVLVLIMGGFVMALPLLGKRDATANPSLLPTILYFTCVALCPALISMALIDRGVYFLGDGPSAFYFILTGIFVTAGFGCYRARHFDPQSDRGIKWAVLRIILCLVLYVFMLTPMLSLLIPLSRMIKVVVLLLLIAPVAYAMGVPLALGLAALREQADRWLPWALGIYAVSLAAAIPLGGMIAVSFGIHYLLFFAVVLSFVALWAYPGAPVMSAPKRS